VRACTFVTAGTVGTRKFSPGDTAMLPEAFVRALVRRGVATDSPLPVDALQGPPLTDEGKIAAATPGAAARPEGEAALEEQGLKKLSRRALKRLLRGK